jgi:DNA-binding NarL/FixJ family response regulator
LIISGVRFVGESLAEALPRRGTLSVSGLFADLQEALSDVANNRPDIILFDEGFPKGPEEVGRIRDVAPQIPVVVIAVAETAQEVIAWAEAGAAGYIPKTASLADIFPLLAGIMRGKQPCSESVAGSLLRRLSSGGPANARNHNMTSAPKLTVREAQIAKMIVAGLSNKDIARHLSIGVATAKTHVHHLLGKLNLQRRSQTATWMREHGDG